MTDANYLKHLKVLGKLCKLYDDAVASVAAQDTLRATTIDQASTGLSADLPASDIIAAVQSSWSAAILAGETALQALALSTARSYLLSSYFRSDLTNTPASVTITAVLDAWILDFTANSKTLTTESSACFINFFDALYGSETTFPGSGSPTYADGTYVVSAVV